MSCRRTIRKANAPRTPVQSVPLPSWRSFPVGRPFRTSRRPGATKTRAQARSQQPRPEATSASGAGRGSNSKPTSRRTGEHYYSARCQQQVVVRICCSSAGSLRVVSTRTHAHKYQEATSLAVSAHTQTIPSNDEQQKVKVLFQKLSKHPLRSKRRVTMAFFARNVENCRRLCRLRSPSAHCYCSPLCPATDGLVVAVANTVYLPAPVWVRFV